MGSVGRTFCRDIQRGSLGGYFLEDCLHLVGSEAGWDVYEEGQVGWGTAGVRAGVRCVCSCSLAGVCLVLLQSGGRSTAVLGWAACCPAWLRGPIVVFDR